MKSWILSCSCSWLVGITFCTSFLRLCVTQKSLELSMLVFSPPFCRFFRNRTTKHFLHSFHHSLLRKHVARTGLINRTCHVRNSNSRFNREHEESCPSTTKNIISLLLQCLRPPNLAGWSLTVRCSHPWNHTTFNNYLQQIYWDDSTSVKSCILLSCLSN